MARRNILITGLPNGLGCTSIAQGLAAALIQLERRVAVAGPRSSLPASLSQAPAARGQYATVFGLGGGAAYAPLELLHPPMSAKALNAQNLDCDFLLMDRFTGLAIPRQDWYGIASEVLVIIDSHHGHDSKALPLIARICEHWPNLPLYLVFNRIPGWPNWQVTGREFNRKCEKYCGRRFPVLGGLPINIEMERASQELASVVQLFPNHPASRVFKHMARQLIHMEVNWADHPEVLVYAPNRNPAAGSSSRIAQYSRSLALEAPPSE